MMYWTDWGTTPKIARGRLDNTYNVDTIVTRQLKWPNGLVIDSASQKLFWADAGMDKIEYSNLDVRSFVLFSYVRLNILQTSYQ